jgi:hypothetical protein
MQMLKMCLNWKVLVGLAVLGVGIYAVAPDVAAAALPILLLALCPLSMLLMMKGMHGDGPQAPETDDGMPRDEQLARLKAQHAALDEKIGALERDELRSSAVDERR